MKTKAPECEKLHAVKDKSQLLGEFIDLFLPSKGITLCILHDENYYPANQSVEKLLAEFFKIDLGKVEKERRAMLAELRKSG